MNHYRSLLSFTKRLLCAGALLSLSGSLVQAQIVELRDRGTTAMVNLTNSMGMYDWSVSGQDQLERQWFWYRLGDGAQHSIDTLGLSSWFVTGNNQLTTTYDNGSLGIQIKYALYETAVGQASIQESIKILNHSGSSISDLHFFQYSDFNLGGTPDGDFAYQDNYSAFQIEGENAIAEAIIAPEASHYEASTTSPFGDSTLFKLVNQSGAILSDSSEAAGDVTWSFQWDFDPIANGAEVDILKGKALTYTVVPEPSTGALIALGFGALGIARRRQAS
jgi:hypothetical protein